jgi:hypothetical protein
VIGGAPLVVETWMARRLGLPLSWDAGVTTSEIRRELIRTAILEQHRALSIAGKRPGHPAETWQALFERLYRQPLKPTEKTR